MKKEIKSKKEKIEKNNNPMKEVSIERAILHCSTADPNKLERSIKLLKFITGMVPVKTLAKKRIPTFKIRPGLEIGCKVTLRGQKATDILKSILVGVPDLNKKQFREGFFSFGIREYIEIPSIPYQRDIGMLGFEVIVILKRKAGTRTPRRKIRPKKIGNIHRITQEETINFFKKNFKTPIID